MTGLDVASLLIGVVWGNLGAVLIPPFNLGLFWNSVTGVLGAGAIVYVRGVPGLLKLDPWYVDIAVASMAALVTMLMIGALVALRYRR